MKKILFIIGFVFVFVLVANAQADEHPSCPFPFLDPLGSLLCEKDSPGKPDKPDKPKEPTQSTTTITVDEVDTTNGSSTTTSIRQTERLPATK